MKTGLKFLGFLVLVAGGGLLIGYSFLPGAWYQSLLKPPMTPPNWLFAPAWTTLYVLIAIAGWALFSRPEEQTGKRAWVLQLVLNFIWSPVVFGAHNLALGLAIILVLWLTIVFFIVHGWGRYRLPAALFLPYLAWVSFAAYLNGGLLVLN